LWDLDVAETVEREEDGVVGLEGIEAEAERWVIRSS